MAGVAISKHRRSVAQPGSASGLGPEGREFESLHSDHFEAVLKLASGDGQEIPWGGL